MRVWMFKGNVVLVEPSVCREDVQVVLQEAWLLPNHLVGCEAVQVIGRPETFQVRVRVQGCSGCRSIDRSDPQKCR